MSALRAMSPIVLPTLSIRSYARAKRPNLVIVIFNSSSPAESSLQSPPSAVQHTDIRHPQTLNQGQIPCTSPDRKADPTVALTLWATEEQTQRSGPIGGAADDPLLRAEEHNAQETQAKSSASVPDTDPLH